MNAEPILTIGRRQIRSGGEPYLIAEVGVNHEGSLEKAKLMIVQAAEGGASAVKFQAYKAKSLAAQESPAYWDLTKEPTKSQRELFKKYDSFGKNEYIFLAEACQRAGLDFLCTPFDLEAVEFLDPLVPAFKVASADITNPLLLRAVAAKKKPVLLSVGAANLAEIREAVGLLKEAGAKEICLLHCVLNYPTLLTDANLNMIEGLSQEFPELVIGYSDHTVPDEAMTVLTLAYLKGALVIEKHFTFDKSLPGNDHYHAMDLADLKRFKSQVAKIRQALGRTEKVPLASEVPARLHARRSLVLARPVRAGEVLDETALVCKRPGSGISAANYDEILGARAARDLPEDHVLGWPDIRREEKIVAVIQARMGSSRFPAKMTARLAGLRLIDWVLARMSRLKEASEVVLALPFGQENDVLAQAAEAYQIRVIRGPERDVLHRFLIAARQTKAEAIIRICADNPFVAPEEIDRLVIFFKERRPDLAFNHLNRLGNNYPDGLGAEIMSRAILEEMAVKAVEKRQREHVTLYLWENPQAFNIQTFEARPEIAWPQAKLDVDYPEDLASLEVHLKKALELRGPLADLTKLSAEELLAPFRLG